MTPTSPPLRPLDGEEGEAVGDGGQQESTELEHGWTVVLLLLRLSVIVVTVQVRFRSGSSLSQPPTLPWL